MKRVEEMAHFFDRRATGYNEHMRGSIDSFHAFYQSIALPVEKTEDQLEILVLGCGTGIEFEHIFRRAPRARITGIDLSKKMLDIIRREYIEYKEQIQLIRGSYLSYPFEEKKYDYTIGVMTMHHLLAMEKKELYQKIKRALKSRGLYIEGDYVVSMKKEREYLKEYFMKKRQIEDDSSYHIDIPFSIKTQKEILRSAGFLKFNLIFSKDEVATYTVQ